MSSDDSRRVGHSGFVQPGVGMYMTFKCAKCSGIFGTANARRIRVGGLPLTVCAACKQGKK